MGVCQTPCASRHSTVAMFPATCKIGAACLMHSNSTATVFRTSIATTTVGNMPQTTVARVP
eukprot:12931154-Prorocentrum_lima.AAC.1